MSNESKGGAGLLISAALGMAMWSVHRDEVKVSRENLEVTKDSLEESKESLEHQKHTAMRVAQTEAEEREERLAPHLEWRSPHASLPLVRHGNSFNLDLSRNRDHWPALRNTGQVSIHSVRTFWVFNGQTVPHAVDAKDSSLLPGEYGTVTFLPPEDASSSAVRAIWTGTVDVTGETDQGRRLREAYSFRMTAVGSTSQILCYFEKMRAEKADLSRPLGGSFLLR